MKYEIDENNYIIDCFFNCNIGTCVEYTGTMPEGYESLEEWHEAQTSEKKLNAWKIVDGDLVYDANKYADLQALYEVQDEENATATHKYVNDRVNGISVEISKDTRGLFDKNSSNNFKVVQLTDTSNFSIDKLVINTTTNESRINLIINTLNMLPNDIISTEKDGLDFNVLEDKSIEISGTTTAAVEIDLAKNNTNTTPILVFKKDVNYYLSGLDGITLNMYNYDGTNRTQIYSGTGGDILFTDSDKQVTGITLSFANSTTVDKTISPMLNLGKTALTYEEYDIHKLDIAIPEYDNLTVSTTLKVSQDLIVKYWGSLILTIENDKVVLHDFEDNELCSVTMPSTFMPNTSIYTIQDTTMSLDYITSKSNGVPYAEVIEAINDSVETVTINADKVNISGVITAINNDTSTTISGNKIKSGSLESNNYVANESGTLINLDNGTIDTKNFKVDSSGNVSLTGSINATSGTFKGTVTSSTITGSTVTIGTVFNLNSSGNFKYYNGVGFLTCGQASGTGHPWMSAVNVYQNNGISFRTGTTWGNAGSQVVKLHATNGFLETTTGFRVNGNINSTTGKFTGTDGDSGSYLLVSSGACALYSAGSSYGVYARGNGLALSLIKTDAGSSSSKSVKKNIKEFKKDKYDKSLEILDEIKLYNYDYKYNLYQNRKQYGFIIDELKELDGIKEFFDFYEQKAVVKKDQIDFIDNEEEHKNEKIIKVSKYDPDVLDKYLLTICKAMYEKIKIMEEKLNVK